MKNNKIKFLPGLGEKPKNYQALSKYLEVVDIDWNTWKIKPKINKEETLTSFSMGGWVALTYTEKHYVQNLVLCSLTPGIETLKDVRVGNVVFLVGEEEKWVHKEIMRVRKTLSCKNRVIVVPGADHKINKVYRDVFLKVLSSL